MTKKEMQDRIAYLEAEIDRLHQTIRQMGEHYTPPPIAPGPCPWRSPGPGPSPQWGQECGPVVMCAEFVPCDAVPQVISGYDKELEYLGKAVLQVASERASADVS